MHRAFLPFLLCHNSRLWIFSRAPQSQLITQSPFLYCPSGRIDRRMWEQTTLSTLFFLSLGLVLMLFILFIMLAFMCLIWSSEECVLPCPRQQLQLATCWCPDSWDSLKHSFRTHVCSRSLDTSRAVFFSSSFSPQGHRAFTVSMRTTAVYASRLHGYNLGLEQWIWHLCGMHLYLCSHPASRSHLSSVSPVHSDQLHSTGGSELSGQPKGCRTQGLRSQT